VILCIGDFFDPSDEEFTGIAYEILEAIEFTISPPFQMAAE